MSRVLSDPLTRWRAWLAERERNGLRRRLHPRAADEKALDLAGNDYLGLARDPRVLAGAIDAIQTWGVGSTGSRLVTGSTELHAELERELAAHCEADASLVFSSGYLANIGAITALSGPDTLVVSDAHNHASVIDACRLSRARVAVVPHCDVAAVESALADRSEESAVVVTDAVFSIDGDVAPIIELHEASRRHGATLIVDEAHAVGVIGDGGEGLVAAAGLGDEPDIVRTVTLSKALGSQGGAVLGARDTVDYLVNAARPFVFDTALSPACVGGALGALRILVESPQLAAAVRRNAARLADLVARPRPAAAVVTVPMPSPQEAVEAAAQYARLGLRVGCFRPPSVPDGISRLRLTARADLSDADLTHVAEAVRAIS